MKIYAWIKRRMKDLCGAKKQHDNRPLSTIIRCTKLECGIVNLYEYQIVGARGPWLIGVRIGRVHGQELIGKFQAEDPNHWMSLWYHFIGDAKFHFEDGTPFEP